MLGGHHGVGEHGLDDSPEPPDLLDVADDVVPPRMSVAGLEGILVCEAPPLEGLARRRRAEGVGEDDAWSRVPPSVLHDRRTSCRRVVGRRKRARAVDEGAQAVLVDAADGVGEPKLGARRRDGAKGVDDHRLGLVAGCEARHRHVGRLGEVAAARRAGRLGVLVDHLLGDELAQVRVVVLRVFEDAVDPGVVEHAVPQREQLDRLVAHGRLTVGDA